MREEGSEELFGFTCNVPVFKRGMCLSSPGKSFALRLLRGFGQKCTDVLDGRWGSQSLPRQLEQITWLARCKVPCGKPQRYMWIIIRPLKKKNTCVGVGEGGERLRSLPPQFCP